MSSRGRVLGTSPSSVKRRRAKYRAAGIDPANVPAAYVSAPDPVRSKMIVWGEVSVAVGMLDTSRGVRTTARRIAIGQSQGYEALPTSHLVGLALLSAMSATDLQALAEVAERRPDGTKTLVAVCSHPACSDTLLQRLSGSPRSSVVRAAFVEQARRGIGRTGSGDLSESQRLELAAAGPIEAAERLVVDPSSRVRCVLAARPLGHASAMVLATDSDPQVRTVLAQFSTNGRVLEWLRSDMDPRVRSLVRYAGDLLLSC